MKENKQTVISGILFFMWVCGWGAAQTPPAPVAAPTPGSAQHIPDPAVPGESNYDLLRQNLEDFLDAAPAGGAVGVCVADPRLSDPVFERNARTPFMPGRCQSLLTSLAALDVLGERYRFRTAVLHTGEIIGNTVEGDLVVRADGDPSLGIAEDHEAILDDFRGWAEQIRSYGIEAVRGALVVDSSAFDDRVEAPGWPVARRGAPDLAPVSACALNENCVDIRVKAGWRKGRQPEYEIFPPNNYVGVLNGVWTVDGGTTPSVKVRRENPSNLIRLTGRMPRRSEQWVRASVHEPDIWFGTVLRETLVNQGVSILAPDPVTDRAAVRARLSSGTTPVLLHLSEPLGGIVQTGFGRQPGFYADMLIKTLGRKGREIGSFGSGGRVVGDWLAERQIRSPGLRLIDGSGLSLNNAVAPITFVDALNVTLREDFGVPWQSLLSEGGWSEKQAGRGMHTLVESRDGRVAVIGFVRTAGGATLSFALMGHDALAPEQGLWDTFDAVLQVIAESPLR